MPAFSRLFAGFAAATLLAGCGSFRPDTVECPNLRVLENTERVSILGAEQGDLVSLRVWRVASQCIQGRGGLEMQVGLALAVERETSQPQGVERVPFDVTFAFLDANGAVVSRYVHSELVAMQGFRLRTNPVVTVEMTVPDNTRVVFGLGKAE